MAQILNVTQPAVKVFTIAFTEDELGYIVEIMGDKTEHYPLYSDLYDALNNKEN